MRIHAFAFAVCALCFASFTACSSDDDTPTNNTADSGTNNNDTSTADTSEALSDAQIAGVAMALNQGEVDAGKLAQMNANKKAVKDFADMMVTEHTAALTREMMLGITAADSPLKTMVESDAMTMMTMLKAKSGSEFDKAYIDGQVTMHQQALDIIDNKLMPAAQAAALKTELTAMRMSVAMHLTEAKSVQSSLGGGDDAGAETGGETGTGDAASGG
jgi:putative membrane protein